MRTSALYWALGCLAAASLCAAQSVTRFQNASKTLLIAQMADAHCGESSERDSRTVELIARMLASERPDLAVFSGDMVSGFAFPASDVLGRASRLARSSTRTASWYSWYEQQWRQLVAPLQAAATPWASILGNHDGEGDLSRRSIAELDAAANLSLTLPGPGFLPGAGNYWIDVLHPQGEQVAARIWMLDSGNRGCGRMAWGWGCVPPETVEWVRRQASALPRVPSLAFVHIPLRQHMLAWNRGAASGSKGEMVGCPGTDSGLFEVAREIGIQAIYSGHDHNNDFEGSVEGIRLAYGRKSGYGSYGPTGGLQHGVRMIELRMGEDPALSRTWIWQEDGTTQEQPHAPAALQDRPLVQYTCALDESGCDKVLGPRACLALRGMRSTAALVAALAALVAAGATALVAAVVLVRHCRQHCARRRGWQPVGTFAKAVDTTV